MVDISKLLFDPEPMIKSCVANYFKLKREDLTVLLSETFSSFSDPNGMHFVVRHISSRCYGVSARLVDGKMLKEWRCGAL